MRIKKIIATLINNKSENNSYNFEKSLYLDAVWVIYISGHTW